MSDPFESSTISLILSWLSVLPLLIGILCLPFGFLDKGLKGNRFLIMWFIVCFIAISPARYFLFMIVTAISYMCQSWGAFFSSCLLAIYVPIIFIILYMITFLLPLMPAMLILGKDEKVSFDRGILASICFPFICVLSTFLFNLLLPLCAWTITWLNPNDVIKATNGAPALIFQYVAAPLTPMRLPQIVEETDKKPKDYLRCHVAGMYLNNKKYSYFIHKQYPDIR